MLAFRYCYTWEQSEQNIEKWCMEMAPEKRQAVLNLPKEKQLEKICADGMVRQLLSSYTGLKSAEIVFEKSENGKPFCPQTSLYFSVSHSYGMVACGISDAPVGIDIERIRPVNPALFGLFSAAERAYLSELPDNKKMECFFKLWTIREAIVKCAGGTVFQMRKLAVSIENGEPYCAEDTILCKKLDLPDGYCGYSCKKVL